MLLSTERVIAHLADSMLSLISSILLVGCIVSSCSASEASSIKRSEYVAVDGARLYLLIRGVDRTAPVLLWLHGGPGGAERPLFRYFNGGLEKHFVVVYWDQRGAGRSFDPEADPRRLTIAQHLADLDAVVNHLRKELGRNTLIVVGHSWGAALGLLYVQAHPDKVSAFIGVNPLISQLAGEQAEYHFVVEQASQRRDHDVLVRAQKIGMPPFGSSKEKLAMESLVQRYGGVFQKEPNRVWVMLRGIFTGLVTPWEIRRIIHANTVSLEAMHQELLSLDLTHSVPSVQVPVSFFLGRYDRHVDARIAAAYLPRLRTPIKRVVWFEKSAHNVPFEEPALFDATIVAELHSMGVQKAGR